MLRQVIYCGQPHINKFILTNFPDTIEQAKAFENDCSKLTAMIFPTANEYEVEQCLRQSFTYHSITPLDAQVNLFKPAFTRRSKRRSCSRNNSCSSAFN